MSKTYEEIGVPAGIEKLIEAKASEPGFESLITPEGLKAWIDAGGNLSDAISGFGPEYEELVIGALMNVEAAPAPVSEPEQTQSVDSQPPKKPDSKPRTKGPKAKSKSKPEKKRVVAKKPEVEMVEVTLKLPLGEVPRGYEQRQADGGRVSMSHRSGTHLQVQLKPQEAQTFLQLREGLRTAGERLDDGRPVWSNPDVLRYLLSRIAAKATQ